MLTGLIIPIQLLKSCSLCHVCCINQVSCLILISRFPLLLVCSSFVLLILWASFSSVHIWKGFLYSGWICGNAYGLTVYWKIGISWILCMSQSDWKPIFPLCPIDWLGFVNTDPFTDANADNSSTGSKDYVHIRVQQRNGRKSLTTVQGLKKEFSYNKILKDLKKEFCCNGTVVQDPELGQVCAKVYAWPSPSLHVETDLFSLYRLFNSKVISERTSLLFLFRLLPYISLVIRCDVSMLSWSKTGSCVI